MIALHGKGSMWLWFTKSFDITISFFFFRCFPYFLNAEYDKEFTVSPSPIIFFIIWCFWRLINIRTDTWCSDMRIFAIWSHLSWVNLLAISNLINSISRIQTLSWIMMEISLREQGLGITLFADAHLHSLAYRKGLLTYILSISVASTTLQFLSFSTCIKAMF